MAVVKHSISSFKSRLSPEEIAEEYKEYRKHTETLQDKSFIFSCNETETDSERDRNIGEDNFIIDVNYGPIWNIEFAKFISEVISEDSFCIVEYEYENGDKFFNGIQYGHVFQSHGLSDQKIRNIFYSVVNGTGNHGSHLRHFANTIASADGNNFHLLKPVAKEYIKKYRLFKLEYLF